MRTAEQTPKRRSDEKVAQDKKKEEQKKQEALLAKSKASIELLRRVEYYFNTYWYDETHQELIHENAESLLEDELIRGELKKIIDFSQAYVICRGICELDPNGDCQERELEKCLGADVANAGRKPKTGRN